MRTLTGLVLAGALLGRSVLAQGPDLDSTPILSLDSLLNTRISAVAKFEQTTREAAASITIVSREEIESFGYRTLADLLAAVPGFYLTDDRLFTTVGVRGFARPVDFNNRLVLLVDGNTVNDAFFGAAPLGPAMALNPDVVERVEIVRGPSSALYGTGAMFAVINLVTRTGKAIDGAHLSTSAGSLGLRGVGVAAGRTAGALDVMASGYWDEVEGQRLLYPEYPAAGLGDGVADHQDWWRRQGLLAVARLGGFHLEGRLLQQNGGVPTGAFTGNEGYYRVNNWGAELRYETDLSLRHGVMARGYLQWHRSYLFFPTLPTTGYGLDVAGDIRGAELHWRWDPASYSRLIVGAEYADHYRARARTTYPGQPALTGSTPSSVVSVYGQEQLTIIPTVTVLGGLRADFYSNGRSSVAPRAAVVVNPRPSSTLKLLYGEALRVPTPLEDQVNELFYTAPRLDPERLRAAEVIWEERLAGWLQGSLSGFLYRGTDFIETAAESTTRPAYNSNNAEVRTTGAELALQARVGHSFHGYGSVETALAENGVTGKGLTNSPSHMIKLGASRHLSGIDFSAELRHEASRTTFGGGSTAPVTLVDLTLAHRPRVALKGASLLKRAELTLQLRNVFDVGYAVPAGAAYIQETIPQNGRTLWASLRYGF